MIDQKTLWTCTECGAVTENIHSVKYAAGFGFIVKAGQQLCDKCLFDAEVKAGYKSDLTDVKTKEIQSR